MMTKEQTAELELQLLNFVKRVTDGNPETMKYPEEVQVLPDIVEMLIDRFL